MSSNKPDGKLELARHSLRIACALTVVAICGGAPLVLADSKDKISAIDNRLEQKYDISFSPQPIASALQELSRIAGFQLVGNSAWFEGNMTQPLEGRFSAFEAVDKLLSANGVQYQ